MAANMNVVILAGNLTRDVELKYVNSGTAVAELTLAVNEYTGKGEARKQIAGFYSVTLWGRTAEIAAEKLQKGSSVLIRGRLRYDQWEKDGQKHSAVRITAEDLQILADQPKRVPDQRQEERDEIPLPF